MSKQISEITEKFIRDYKEVSKLEKAYNQTGEEKIKVHQVSSKAAFLYEKLRNSVDYQEDHLLRKIAIERILKRRLMTEKNEIDVSKFLIYELIRARYLPNDVIPEKRIDDIKEIIEKYTLLINNIPEAKNTDKNSNEHLFDWVVGIASCEIEEKIAPYKKENIITEFAEHVIDEKLKVSEKIMTFEDKKIQIYIAVLKNLTKSNLSLIEYRLFERKYPEWFLAPSEELIIRMAQNINGIINSIEKQINNPVEEKFSRFVKKNLAYFMILEDVVQKNINNVDKVFSYHLYVEDAVKESCVKKYKTAKLKLKRAATRSIIYIFITKMFLALLLEFPFDKYIINHINYFALGINIMFPPFLMLLVVVTIKIPSKKNTELIVQGIKEMIYGKYSNPLFVIKRTIYRNSFFSKIFKFFYFFVFFISFGLIIFILRKINFNIVSIALFIFFLSVVSYFGIRIRQNAKELVVIKRKEGIVTFVTDLFSIPILQMGKWLSLKLSSINVFVFILDFIIEAPFKTFVEIFEEWIYFIKEEKDKIY